MLKKGSKSFVNKSCRGYLILFLVISVYSKAQVVSPFNNLTVSDSSENYTFLVSGHFHGASTSLSTFPASTLLANIDTINSLHSLFLMSLGDLFLDVNENYLTHYKVSLFDKLKMPLLNSVGNHDLSRNIYEKKFGKTFFSFIHKTELFIVLNTEEYDGSIKSEQLSFFENAINLSIKGNIKNIFVFSHRPIWAESISKYSKLFPDNTHTDFGKNNFQEEILPILNKVSDSKNIYWISGSMGGGAPSSFFYDKDLETKITYIQTAIRDLPRDAILQAKIENGIVTFKGISITGQNLKLIEEYNLEYWAKNNPPESAFNYRLIPYLTKQMLLHHYFGIGFLFGGIFILLFILIIKKWRRRK